jgi:hypothetical protein
MSLGSTTDVKRDEVAPEDRPHILADLLAEVLIASAAVVLAYLMAQLQLWAETQF